MKVLVTGAAGHVATLTLPGLVDHHELRLADIKPLDRVPTHARFQAVNLLDASDADLHALFEGVEVVVHSAYIPSGEVDVYSATPPQIDRFEAEFANLRVAQRVYRTALEAGVRRVVMVSSNHAADWYEHAQVHLRQRDMVYPTDLPLADNFYGWSKASYELLGHPYACGTFGRSLEVVMLRIGSPYPIQAARYDVCAAPVPSSLPRPKGVAGFKRALGAWLSPRDCAALVRCAVEATHIVATNEVPWVVAYGISDNTRAFWSLESARRQLGYQPQDDSEVTYAADIQRLLMGAGPAAAGRLGVRQ
ncbi:MAG: NAD(P)-dependent oxidoreductase [Hydrogenophaga sp.]|nr:NAD(P)-dependent oxidoreductase [Hydrogenophaga sp.]